LQKELLATYRAVVPVLQRDTGPVTEHVLRGQYTAHADIVGVVEETANPFPGRWT